MAIGLSIPFSGANKVSENKRERESLTVMPYYKWASTVDDSLIAKVVYLESGQKHHEIQWGRQLIVDCVLYRYFLYIEDHKPISFKKWINLKSTRWTFQGLLREKESYLPMLATNETSPAYMHTNVERYKVIRKNVLNRILEENPNSHRQVRNYHHSKVKVVELEGKKRPLNFTHIRKIESSPFLKKIVHKDLYHDFFEERSINPEWYKFRKTLSKIYKHKIK